MGELLLPANKKLSNVDELVPQSRLDKVYERLWQRGHEDLVQLLTVVAYVQPPTERIATETVYFRVISPHPKPVFPDQTLETIGTLPMSRWREADGDDWRFVGAPDPLLAIFAGLIRQHMETYNNLKELI